MTSNNEELRANAVHAYRWVTSTDFDQYPFTPADEASMSKLLGEEAGLRSTRERYWLIGRALRIPLFQELSQLMRGIETEGLSPREEYPALSRISAESRLAQNRLRAARAKTGAAAAIALLLIPLLIMVGGGIAFAFLGSVTG